MATQLERFGPVTPSDADRALAAESIRRLAPLVKNSHQLTVVVQAENGPGERLVLPAPAVQLLTGILAELARGHTMTAYPIPTELTTQEAADLLNVSRPYLISLLDRTGSPTTRSARIDESHSRISWNTAARARHGETPP